MKKQPNAWLEFGIVFLLLIAAVIFGYTVSIDWSWFTKLTGDKEAKVTAVSQSPEAVKWQQGKDLFRSDCAACHNLKHEGTGPALVGVAERWDKAGDYQGKSGAQWLHLWIKNWNDPVKAGYPYAVNMANSRPAQMNTFSNLSDEDINLILNYIAQPDGVKPAS